MDPKKTAPMLLVLFVVITATMVEPARGSTCMTTFFATLVQMIPCRPAVAPFSPILPSEACCNAIKALGQPCLCVLLSGPPISGMDRNMALQLPSKCTANFEPSKGKPNEHLVSYDNDPKNINAR
ncbi:hypothetical protein CDL15_Pgr028844 [Punica granatum]|uniref:Bifunctional inhibitor/plant lipid transfer protein/seed storage helical domain-containing protein n=1 Tax=Punica granatum TaxID=22663 RepID=A0A218WWK4_PUNGR|nr:hypothetical protein CDL15_Pgr028844 [Punica granatum]